MAFSHSSRIRCCLPLVTALAAMFTLAGRAEPSEPVLGGTLSGKVVDASGNPVTKARVWIADPASRNLAAVRNPETVTDSDGRFRLGPLDPSYRPALSIYYQAEESSLGYIMNENVSIYPGRDLDLGIIHLDSGRKFAGQVLGADGKPCPDASVDCRLARNIQGHTVVYYGPSVIVKTDENGRFRTPPVGIGRFAASVELPGHQRAGLSRRTAPGGEEILDPIRLAPDVPLPGLVTDIGGQPLAGVQFRASGRNVISDRDGRISIRGFGANPRFQLQGHKEGYLPINWSVRVSEQGIFLRPVPSEGAESGPFPQLTIPMEPVAWIEGRAVDDETGEPVRLEKVVICYFQRKPNGEVVLSGCRNPVFEQPKPGIFRVSYSTPDEYHLAFSAPGYHDSEAFTPKVTTLKTIDGIVAKMIRRTDGSKSQVPSQKLLGNVARDGKPVKVGWAGLWSLPKPRNAVNAPVMRGRLVEGGPMIYGSAPIRDGAFELKIPFQSESWYVVVEEPGHALTQVGPVTVALNEQKKLDITCVSGGGIHGHVKGVPQDWDGHLWVVAFSRTGVRSEGRVLSDSTFSLPTLPPGEYGLKVGHDAYEDQEVYPGQAPPKAYQEQANPWLRAKTVNVKSGRELDGVEIEYFK